MNILFMCVANSARSQIAEGLARAFIHGADIQSAGSSPGKLNPYAVQVMQEIGIDISKHYAKSAAQLSPDFSKKVDYVITLCAEEVCPVLPESTAKNLQWPFPDPVSKEFLPEAVMLHRFRSARDNIRSKILEFAQQLNRELNV